MWDLGPSYELFVKAPMNNDLTVLHVARLAQVRTETPSESGGESEGIELSPLKAASKDNMDNVKDTELKSVPSVASISTPRETNALESMSTQSLTLQTVFQRASKEIEPSDSVNLLGAGSSNYELIPVGNAATVYSGYGY